MDISASQLKDRFSSHFIRDLKEFASYPTISAEGRSLDECASYLKDRFERAGLSARLLRLSGAPPLVYAEAKGSSPFTLVFYNHYDVQPVDPLDEWASPPFELRHEGDRLYARGIADDKGDLMARLHAVELLMQRGELPIGVKFVVEGEEEVGSARLAEYIKQYGQLMKGDLCLWEGADITEEGRPQFYFGVKGLLYVELRVETASRDQHSMLAAISPNPAWRLIWLLAHLKSADERVLIPGFYEDVKELTKEELQALASNDFDPERLRREIGSYSLLPYSDPLEVAISFCSRPTCNIAGLLSGYTGKGTKTVLPRAAMAKLDFRLVPDQRPEKVLELLKAYIRQLGYGDIEVIAYDGELPARVPMNHPYVEPLIESAQAVYAMKPNLWPSMAGTGPMALFINELTVPSIMAPSVSYAGSGYHAPNEHIMVEHYLKAVAYHVEAISRLAGLAQRKV
jgi:acetylornithine deacetylase/succinyl-diaminopimelate desuccinylase-like protein